MSNPLLRVLKYSMLYALIGSSSFAAEFTLKDGPLELEVDVKGPLFGLGWAF
jgi:hypothetical protein